MYAYCNNNPVMHADYSGELFGEIAISISAVVVVCLLVATAVAYDATHYNVLGNAIASVANSIIQNDTSSENSFGYTVYKLVDSNDKVQYVGRTKNAPARERAHKNDPFRKDLAFVPIEENLSKEQARGLEQYYMVYYHTLNTLNKQNNQINGISISNPKRNLYIEAAVKYLGNLISNEILDLIGI